MCARVGECHALAGEDPEDHRPNLHFHVLTLSSACGRLPFLRDEPQLSLALHLLVEADGATALARGMKSIGSRLALTVNRVFGRRGPVLADRFHHRVLRTPREVRNVLAYVLRNVWRHAAKRGCALRPPLASIDPASSGRWFDGWARAQPAPRDAPAVAPPRGWLLRIGWWRHGRIEPVPAAPVRRGQA